MDIKNKNQQALNNLRDKLKETISATSERYAQGLSETATEVFVHNAKTRLLRGVAGSNMANVDSVLNNISASKESSSFRYLSTIYVRQDPEGLAMFLEYGTGILGAQKRHPEAKSIGWKYKTRLKKGKPFKVHSGSRFVGLEKSGWFFSSKKGTFISARDEHPVLTYKQRTITEHIEAKDGKVYDRTRRVRSFVGVKQNTVFTQGLYPVKYFYNTKQEFKKIFKHLSVLSKEGHYESKGSKLNEFKSYINSKRL